MSVVYAVEVHWPSGAITYHSVWMLEQDARRVAAMHDGTWRQRYIVKAHEPVEIVSGPFDRQRCVKLPGSVGALVLQPPLRISP